MVASVTYHGCTTTVAHRTCLCPDGGGEARIDTPRRAMGGLLGHAVPFGQAHDVMTDGEGIETILSLRMVLPHLPAAAALPAAPLSDLLCPAPLRRLTIARLDDPAVHAALKTSTDTSRNGGTEG